DPNKAPSWNMTPNSVRMSYSSLAEHSVMSVPSTVINPRSGRSKPISDFKKTDLPVPEGPSSTLTSPSGTSNVTSSQIRWDPKDFVSPSTWIPIPIRNPPAERCPSPPKPSLWHESL